MATSEMGSWALDQNDSESGCLTTCIKGNKNNDDNIDNF